MGVCAESDIMLCRKHHESDHKRRSNLEYLTGEARPVDLHPEEVFDPKQLPLTVTVTLHCLKVPSRTLLAHNGALQLLQNNKI